MAFKCIVVMVKPDLTDQVVEASKKAGASGATIVPASGTGIREAKTFFGLTLDVRTDVILFVLDEAKVEAVFNAVQKAGRFDEPGTGIAFVMPVESTAGMSSQLSAESQRKK